jgi:hypothetical protein
MQAGLAPFYLAGTDRISVALLPIGFGALFLLFLCRKRWTWLFMLVFTFIQPIISVSNFPSETYYGTFTFAARVLIIIQAIVVIFVAMLMPATKR